MANISFDFSNNAVFKRDKDTKTYIYRDIGTENFQLIHQKTDKKNEIKLTLYSINTSNFDQQAVESALRNLFNFRLGEEILEPEFGNQLYRYLYEPINKYAADKIGRTIEQMIDEWEPRIKISNINIEGDDTNYCYYIKIEYVIPELSQTSEFELTLSR